MLKSQPLPGDVEQRCLFVAAEDLGDGLQCAAHGPPAAGAQAGQVDGRWMLVNPRCVHGRQAGLLVGPPEFIHCQLAH